MDDTLRLYVVVGSHPSAVAERGLALKGLEYERVVLAFGPSIVMQKLRFGRRTVPGLQVGAQRVSGSRLILRALEGLAPQPSFYPDDPATRAEHDEVERWGDLVFQESARWLLALAGLRSPQSLAEQMPGPALPSAAIRLGVRAQMRALGRTEAYALGELDALPEYLDRIEVWLAHGVLGSVERPTAAGLQLGSSLRLLLTFEDFAPGIDGRPLGPFARGLFPQFPGSIPAGVLA